VNRYAMFAVGVVSAVLVSTIVETSVVSGFSRTAATQDRFPDARGKTELLKVCGGCHGAETVLAHAQTADGWAETLGRMVQLGAEGTQEEWRLVQQYLDSQLALIAINKAAADEIRRTVDVPDAVVQAIVTYRREHGNFKSIDDLKNVPGLDAAKVEACRDRLIF
jgi:competence protein ComEA